MSPTQTLSGPLAASSSIRTGQTLAEIAWAQQPEHAEAANSKILHERGSARVGAAGLQSCLPASAAASAGAGDSAAGSAEGFRGPRAGSKPREGQAGGKGDARPLGVTAQPCGQAPGGSGRAMQH